MAHKELSIAVIGGGIGGLSAALSLLRAGADVHVYERARTISEVGAGIAVSPNATRILYRLGLAEALEANAVKPTAWHYHRWEDGRTLLRTPLAGAMEAAFGFPLYHMHRGRPGEGAGAGDAPGASAHRAQFQNIRRSWRPCRGRV